MSSAPETNGTARVPVAEILPPDLLQYAHDITFPWDLDKPLNASKVGQWFYGEHDPSSDWDVPEVKNALLKLAALGSDEIRFEDFANFVRNAHPEDGDNPLP